MVMLVFDVTINISPWLIFVMKSNTTLNFCVTQSVNLIPKSDSFFPLCNLPFVTLYLKVGLKNLF